MSTIAEHRQPHRARTWSRILPQGDPAPPTCASCSDTGYVIQPDGGVGTARPCACRQAPPVPGTLRSRLETAGLSPSEIRVAMMPGEAWRLDRYTTTGIRSELQTLAAAEWPTATPWLLCGDPGTGKTTAAARACAEWIRRVRGSVAWVSVATDLQHALADRYDDRQRGARQVEDRWQRAALLVLDGLGDERGTEARVDLLAGLLIERERRCNTQGLIVTTNAADWGELLDWRLVSRLSSARVVQLAGPDWRALLGASP